VIVAVAVCPHPPLLVPEVAPGTAEELAEVRDACHAAVTALLAADPDRVVVIGGGDHAGGLTPDLDETAGGSLASYGAAVHAGGPGTDLPLSLTIGAWLLDRAGWTGPRTYSTARPEVDGRVALLVMADGTGTRTPKAPGALDDRAEAFDAAIAAALAAGDPEALASLDIDLGAELWSRGVPTLRTLGEMTKGADVTAHLRVAVAPFGVGYLVADWVLG
jgi:aromatic ring-opening dioxygenase LigB subunit